MTLTLGALSPTFIMFPLKLTPGLPLRETSIPLLCAYTVSVNSNDIINFLIVYPLIKFIHYNRTFIVFG